MEFSEDGVQFGPEDVEPKDDKFICFKREDFLNEMVKIYRHLEAMELAMIENANPGIDMDEVKATRDTGHKHIDNFMDGMMEKVIGDAVVIRTQDRFAGPLLHSYAAMMAAAKDMAFDLDQAAEFTRIGDYFHKRALEADAGPQRMPD